MTGIQAQRNFAARIRQPGVNPLPEGVPAERMAIYEQLFFNTIEGFLSSGFPVSRRLFEEARWRRLVGDFLAGYRCTTPYFPAVGEEFLGWLSDGYCPHANDPPFLLELAHYEWVELALELSPAELPSVGWSPLAWPLAYVWPVQRIGPDCRPELPPEQPTCLLAWRDGQDRVRFMQLGPFAYRLALRLRGGETPEAALKHLAEESGIAPDAAFYQHADELLEAWRRQDIFIGSGSLPC